MFDFFSVKAGATNGISSVSKNSRRAAQSASMWPSSLTLLFSGHLSVITGILSEELCNYYDTLSVSVVISGPAVTLTSSQVFTTHHVHLLFRFDYVLNTIAAANTINVTTQHKQTTINDSF